MIDETRQEQASLYVLGLLTEVEKAAFERGLDTDPELRAEVYALRDSALIFAHSVPLVAPPADMREKILAGFAAAAAPVPAETPFPASAAPVVSDMPAGGPAKPRGGSVILHLIPWAAAAALAVLLVKQKAEFAELADSHAKNKAATAAEWALVESASREALAAAQKKAAADLAREREARAAAETALTGATAEKTTLAGEIASLREAAKIDRTRIAVLSSTAARAPKAVAVSVWSQDQQAGVLVVDNLPALPAGRDYQLWVIDPAKGTPVSAGVFKVDDKGKVRIEFKPVQPIGTADKFAITIEREGGSEIPTLTKLVGIGG